VTPRVALLVCAALAACVEPTQYGGPIAVDRAGLAHRLRALCSAGLGPATTDDARASLCPAPPRRIPRPLLFTMPARPP
jgi:hypothetical protein